MNYTLPDADKCFGCGACENICPRNCIELKTNEYGERKPTIVLDDCIFCKQCEKVCPALSAPIFRWPRNAKALVYKDEQMRKGSASGGAAVGLYRYALQQDMIIYGCTMDQNHVVRFSGSCEEAAIQGYRNSKYTYSRMEDSFRQIRGYLKKGKKVLFIGTSCQTDALLRFCGENDNLLLVDLICHGIPPEGYFRNYIEGLEKKFGKHIDHVEFRGEVRNRDYFLKMFSNDRLLLDESAFENAYFAGYVNYVIFEEKCYGCLYARGERISDITIGDWWGATDIAGRKLSMVLVNTEKGEQFACAALSDKEFLIEEHSVYEAVQSNEQLMGTAPKPPFYQDMRECYKEHGFEVMSQKFIGPLIRQYKAKCRKAKIRSIVMLPYRALRKVTRVLFS